MNPYTDQQLQLALAKMLPDKITIDTPELGELYIIWKYKYTGNIIRDTEWLHVCWLIVYSMPVELVEEYGRTLTEYSSWQERAIALAKVKGVEIV